MASGLHVRGWPHRHPSPPEAMPARDASQFFDHYSASFDEIYGGGRTPWARFINRQFRTSLWLRFAETLAACQPVANKLILDVGCGPGHYVAALAQAGALRVVGLDSAPSMIELAKARCKHAGLEKRCELICTKFEDFHARGRFDHVICMGFLEYVAEPLPLLEGMMQMCKGTALFSLPDRHGFLAWQRRVRYRFRTPLFMYSLDEVEALFKSAQHVADFEIRRLARDFFISARPSGSHEAI